MRFKLPKRSWVSRTVRRGICSVILLGAFAASSLSQANVTVDPIGQLKTLTNGLDSVHYADVTARAIVPGPNVPRAELAPGFTEHNFANPAQALRFYLSGIPTDRPYLYAYAVADNTQNTLTHIKINGTDHVAANGAVGAEVYFRVADICPAGAVIRGCNNPGTIFNLTAPIEGVTLHFHASASAVAPIPPPSGETTALFLVPQVRGPLLSACPPSPHFFPGDESILVDTSLFTVTANATYGGSPAMLRVWAIAARTPTMVTNYADGEIIRDAPFGAGEQPIGGFVNLASINDQKYSADFGVQDSSGLITFCGRAGENAEAIAGYPLNDKVFASNIQGFLKESNCFVATASYRDGRAPGVMLLREFRDKILDEFALGRAFIRWYYAEGPRGANWLIERPVYRTVVLAALIPLQIAAWIALHPAALSIPIAAFVLLVLTFGLPFRRFRGLGVVVAILASGAMVDKVQAAEPNASEQPYIDSLISELPAEQFPARSDTNPDPYIQSLKKSAGTEEPSQGYSEELRKELPPSDGSENYTKRVRRGLSPTTGSAIEDYRKGKKLRANKGGLETRSAFGFKLAASATRTYSAGENQDRTFDEVYGNSWIPDFAVHYEYRPFTSDFLKKLGLYASLGTSFTKADGILEFDPSGQFASRSRTQFRFVSIPFNVGLIYRINVANFIYPFFGAGPSTIGFVENRSDKQPSQRGYTFGYWYTAGVAFGLDWISPRSSWDQYESNGTKHTYLTLDYTYLESMAGGLVEFTVDGVQIGFTFEM